MKILLTTIAASLVASSAYAAGYYNTTAEQNRAYNQQMERAGHYSDADARPMTHSYGEDKPCFEQLRYRNNNDLQSLRAKYGNVCYSDGETAQLERTSYKPANQVPYYR